MADFTGVNAAGTTVYFQGSGTGTSGDKFIPESHDSDLLGRARTGLGEEVVILEDSNTTGTFAAIAAPFEDVTLTSVTLSSGSSGSGSVNGKVLPQGSVLPLPFTAITVSGCAVLYKVLT